MVGQRAWRSATQWCMAAHFQQRQTLAPPRSEHCRSAVSCVRFAIRICPRHYCPRRCGTNPIQISQYCLMVKYSLARRKDVCNLTGLPNGRFDNACFNSLTKPLLLERWSCHELFVLRHMASEVPYRVDGDRQRIYGKKAVDEVVGTGAHQGSHSLFHQSTGEKAFLKGKFSYPVWSSEKLGKLSAITTKTISFVSISVLVCGSFPVVSITNIQRVLIGKSTETNAQLVAISDISSVLPGANCGSFPSLLH